jgi:hypothetical protein
MHQLVGAEGRPAGAFENVPGRGAVAAEEPPTHVVEAGTEVYGVTAWSEVSNK